MNVHVNKCSIHTAVDANINYAVLSDAAYNDAT